MEDELAGSLRELKPIGKDDALRERFDSIFRRNLIEVEDTERTIAGRRKYKSSYKFKKRQGSVYGTAVQKLDKKNKKKKAELDAKQKQGFLQDDLIML